MTKIILWCALCVFSALPLGAKARSLDCSGLPKTTVVVTLAESGIQKNYSYSFTSLKGMTDRYVDPTIDVLGLTVGNAVVRTEIQSRLLQDSAGAWECSTHEIAIQMGFSPIVVYVGKEFPQGSCGFTEIDAHEMRHAEIYQAHAQRVIAEANEVLRARFDALGILRGPLGSTQERIRAELAERWVPYLRRLLGKAEILQRGVDTRAEYERVAGSCQGEIKKVIRATKG